MTPRTDLPVEAIPASIALAGWLVAIRVRGWGWAVVVLPAVAVVLMYSGVVSAFVPERLVPFVIAAPSFFAVIAGVVVSRSGRGYQAPEGIDPAAERST